MARNCLLILTLLALALLASSSYIQYQDRLHCSQCSVQWQQRQHFQQQCFCKYYPTFICCEKPQLPMCQMPTQLPVYTQTYEKCVESCKVNIYCIQYCQTRFHQEPHFPRCHRYH
nr:hypothetical transcript [Hymenolepis microstoma]